MDDEFLAADALRLHPPPSLRPPRLPRLERQPIRYPSNLISWSHVSPRGGFATSVASCGRYALSTIDRVRGSGRHRPNSSIDENKILIAIRMTVHTSLRRRARGGAPERPWYTRTLAGRPGSSVVEQRTFNARAAGSSPAPVISYCGPAQTINYPQESNACSDPHFL